MDEYRVKYRLTEWYVTIEDKLGVERMVHRFGRYGQRLHAEEGVNTDTDIYGVPQSELDRLEEAGVFFSEQEISRMAPAAEEDDEFAFEGDAPSFDLSALAAWQLEERFRDAGIPTQDLLDALERTEGEERQAFADRILSSENAVTGGEPREDLVLGVAAILGDGGAAQIPAEEENGGGSDEPPTPEEREITPAALEYAKEHGIDLSLVVETAKAGKVTQPDVKAYQAAQENK